MALPPVNTTTQKIKSSWVNNLDATSYVAPAGMMFFDTATGVLRLGDAETPGGIIVGGGGGNGTPAGPNGSLQFNNGGAFGGNSALTYDAANATLNLTGLANVAGDISATGNITGNYILGNGAFLTGVITSVSNIANGTSNVSIDSANANITVAVDGTSNVAVFTSTGLDVTGNVTSSDTITANNTVSANVVAAQNGLFINANVVAQSYTIPPGYNAISAGPVTVPPGVVVDSIDGNWVIV